ncbi:MAG: glutaminase [Rhodospirillaceae bacterium]|nr:glutaminase [Rhodospirillaceae bacterium]MDD9915013.1 glutaminase [Rhodospirillaceae bacterium]MDD9926825.1 glutaminase [Rhodospirillaceae bacterium]
MSLSEIVEQVHREMADHIGAGKVADYIPALAEIDPRKFGLAVVTCDGDTASAGDADEPFSIQSVSKVFTLTLALEKAGVALWERVGREPTGSAFNSIVQLEHEAGIPRNPLINAGAIVVTDELLADHTPEQTVEDIVAFLRTRADDPSVGIDLEVAWSEGDTGDRNASLAHFMRSFGNLKGRVEDVLHVYFRQCAIAMSCRQLARAGLYLAHAGTDPMTGERVISEVRTRRINAIMMSCGHYDASGEFAFQVGLPGKSGVGGGILAIAPRQAAIAVWSPGLNERGNSLVGTLALERLGALTGWSVF